MDSCQMRLIDHVKSMHLPDSYDEDTNERVPIRPFARVALAGRLPLVD